MEQTSAGFLVLILDTNPSHWWRNGDGMPANQSDLSFQKTVESVLIFVSSYLLLNRSNRLIFLAAHAGSSVTLYPDALSESESGDQIGLIRNIVLKKLLALSEQTHDSTLKSTTSISGSISRGLCCMNRVLKGNADLFPRIFVIQRSPDVPEHYISIMNSIFSAQKKNVAIDACILSQEHSPFMQQATYLTGGIYYKPRLIDGLLQYLITLYLPDPNVRKMFRFPSQESVDFRAMCFCHKKAVSTAYVCPVCLSLFCQFQPICSTCGVRSRLSIPKKLATSKQPK
ncbi:unnamed protein product [Albugo candida]|uniref:General transcription factor IIH subunit n=1 Tax=Albugo candida TaxID=65357 RepID=A0A024GUF1_9STRA|nr:unnamed protein product [Albugo candida]|eukprot:CCI50237.1 unnamed protein product [Albugo candida]